MRIMSKLEANQQIANFLRDKRAAREKRERKNETENK